MQKKRALAGGVLDLGVKNAGLASFVLLGKFISVAVGVLMLVIVARFLGPGGYGIYTIAIAIAGFVGAFGSISIGYYFNKVIPGLLSSRQHHKIGVLVGDSIFFVLALSVVLTIIGALGGKLIGNYILGSYTYTLDMYVAMLSIFWFILYPILNTILVSFGTGREVALSTMSGITFQGIISIVLVVMGFGPIGAIVGYLFGFVFATLITLVFIHRHYNIRLVFGGMKDRLNGILRFSVPITLSGIVNTITTNFSVIFLGLLLIPAGLIGQYGLATRIGTVIDVASGAIAVVLIPMFATALNHKKTVEKIGKLYQHSIYYGLVFTIPIIVYTTVLSRAIILTVFTAAYTQTIVYMPLISIGILIQLLATYAYSLVISVGKVKRVLKFSIYVSVIQVVSMLVLGPFFKVLGVIAAFFYIGSLAYVFFYVRELRTYGIRIDTKPLVKVLISNVTFGLLMIPLAFLPIRPLYILILGIIEIIVVYPIALAKTKAISGEELGVLHRVSDGIPVFRGIFRSLLNYTARFI